MFPLETVLTWVGIKLYSVFKNSMRGSQEKRTNCDDSMSRVIPKHRAWLTSYWINRPDLSARADIITIRMPGQLVHLARCTHHIPCLLLALLIRFPWIDDHERWQSRPAEEWFINLCRNGWQAGRLAGWWGSSTSVALPKFPTGEREEKELNPDVKFIELFKVSPKVKFSRIWGELQTSSSDKSKPLKPAALTRILLMKLSGVKVNKQVVKVLTTGMRKRVSLHNETWFLYLLLALAKRHGMRPYEFLVYQENGKKLPTTPFWWLFVCIMSKLRTEWVFCVLPRLPVTKSPGSFLGVNSEDTCPTLFPSP